MANRLFCSLDAAIIGDAAWQVSREGHNARCYIEAASDREIADGFVPKTDDWRAGLDWADVVVFDGIWAAGADDVGTGKVAQQLRAGGDAVVDRTPGTDRTKGFQLHRTVEGVNVAVCGFFNDDQVVEPIHFNFEHDIRYLVQHFDASTADQTQLAA